MSKKLLGMVTAGLLAGIASNASATVMTPLYDTSWQAFSGSSYQVGAQLVVAVTDFSGDTGGNSTLNIANVSGLDLTGMLSVGSVTGNGTAPTTADPLVLQTLDGIAGGDCSSYLISNHYGGDCSYAIFNITNSAVSFDWQMLQDQTAGVTASGDTIYDFAFTVYGGTEAGNLDSYLTPKSAGGKNLPEPATVALMAIGLLGVGASLRQKKRA